MVFGALDARALCGVLDDKAQIGQVVADGVGQRPVLLTAGLGTQLKQGLRGGVGVGGGASVLGRKVNEAGGQALVAIALEGDAEHGHTPVDDVSGKAACLGVDAALSLVEIGIGGGHEAEDGTCGTGGVEVVIHAGLELGASLLGRLRELGGSICALGGVISRPGQVLHGVCDALKRAGGTAQALEGEVQRAAVMGLGHKQAQRVGGVLVEHVLEREEVAQRLAHLLAVDQEHARVHPMVGELAAPGALGLGALVLMMGELQVGAAAVDVDGHAQIAVHHGGALGVPAGTARAPRRVPRGLAGLCGLP